MKTTRVKQLLLWIASGSLTAVARGAGLGPEDVASVSWFTDCTAILFTMGIALVFALEVVGRRRDKIATTRALPAKKTYRPLFVVKDDDGRTRVFRQAPQMYLLSGKPPQELSDS
jgi:hypothetical protein